MIFQESISRNPRFSPGFHFTWQFYLSATKLSSTVNRPFDWLYCAIDKFTRILTKSWTKNPISIYVHILNPGLDIRSIHLGSLRHYLLRNWCITKPFKFTNFYCRHIVRITGNRNVAFNFRQRADTEPILDYWILCSVGFCW